MSSSQSSSSSSSSSILPQAAHSSDSPTIHHARHLSSNPQPNPHSEPSNSPVNITLSLPNPPSLHPTIRFTLYPHLESSITERECVKPEIWITITLPDEIFVDPDELSGKWGVSGPSTSIGSRAYVEVKDDDDDEDESKGSANKVQVQSFGGGHRSGRPREQGRMNSEVVWWNVDPSKVDVERPSRGLWTSEDPDPSPPLHTLNMVLRLSPSSLWSTDMESMQQPHDIRDSVEGGQISEWTTDIDVPLHARYLAPSEEGKREIVFPISRRGDIKAGWICVDDKGDSAWGVWQNLHSPHNQPDLQVQPITLTFPTGRHSHQLLVERVTPLVIWLGWGWLVYKILRLRGKAMRRRCGGGQAKEAQSKVPVRGGTTRDAKIKAL